MSQDTNVSNLIINKLTKQQYEGITTPDPTQLYFITDEGEALSGLSDVSLSNVSNGQILKYNSTTSKWENTAAPSSAEWGSITGTLSNQADLSNALNSKQDTLVSGTNIKTINNTSLLGNGNISVLQNTATGIDALTILGNPTQYVSAINIGASSYANERFTLAIGENAVAGSEGSIMLGYGSNTNKSLVIGFPVKNGNIYTSQTYELLDGTTGLIPDARISSNIARTSALPSLATTSTAGIVQPDGSTITVSNGVISATPVRNIGEIVQSTIPLTDAGLHLLDGSLISGAGIYADFVTYIAGLVNDYPDLFETEANWQTSVTTYGVCGKFVYDSTNNTIRLPKITGIIEGTVDATALGDLVEAGLPNITGTLPIGKASILAQYSQGAFSSYTATGHRWAVGSEADDGQLNFNASLSNLIYGNSTTVQPQTIKAFIYIVIATNTKTEIEVDIDEIATDLNGKIDTDFTNINSTGIEALLSTIYPVGAVYISTTSTCPLATLMPNATWTKKAEDRVLQGSSSTHTEGTTIAAGLPNITGTADFSNIAGVSYPIGITQVSGSLGGTSWGTVANIGATGYNSTAQKLSFDASYSSSIYGNSTTVQPPAYVVSVWERTA